jgi:PhnB protein
MTEAAPCLFHQSDIIDHTDQRVYTGGRHKEASMSGDVTGTQPIAAKIAPWLSVADASRAVEYFAAAFGAVELERLEDETGNVEVAHLTIGEADFWVQRDVEADPRSLGDRSPVRKILTVEDPDAVFARAIRAGATEVAAIVEDHGWRVGRLADPSGHHWEVGKPLTP